VDYYPNWPSCPTPSNSTVKCEETTRDCSLKKNICGECCGAEKVKKTGILPPGMYPVNCYPGTSVYKIDLCINLGRIKVPPFQVLFTVPHFNQLPPEVISSVDGLRDLGEKANPFVFKYVPVSSMLIY
jgi:hypothetical protein